MNKKIKQILSVSLSILVSTMLVAGAAMATTTISENIATGGTLTVTGTSALTGATTVTGALYGDGGLDRSGAATLTIGGTNANVLNISKSGVMTTVKGTLNVDEAVTFDTTLGVTGATTLTGALNATKMVIDTTGATTKALQIHSHDMAAVADSAVANEFKGEFLNTNNTMDGIAAHYHMAASGTGVMRSILGVAYLDTGKTLSGADAAASWISGILGSVNVAGTVNGTAVTVTGVYGGLGSMTGGTLTEVNDMSAIWADSQAIQVPSAGNSQLILATNSGAGTIGSGLRIDAVAGAITRDITLQNDETIDNATNGIVAVGGNLKINGARVATASASSDLYEQFLNVNGNITGVGNASPAHNAKTWMVQVTGTRPLGSDVLSGDFDDTGLKISVTNKATGNAAGYVFRGFDVSAVNRESVSDSGNGGSVTTLQGGSVSATQKASSPVVTNLMGLNVKVEQDSPNGTVPTNLYGLNVEYDAVMASPTNSAGVRVYQNSNTAFTAPLAGYQVSYNSTGTVPRGLWQYGLVIDSGSVQTADIRLSSGAEIKSGNLASPEASNVDCAVVGSLYTSTNDGTLWSCTVAGVGAAATWVAR